MSAKIEGILSVEKKHCCKINSLISYAQKKKKNHANVFNIGFTALYKLYNITYFCLLNKLESQNQQINICTKVHGVDAKLRGRRFLNV